MTEFEQLVMRMREFQKRYFKTRDNNVLSASGAFSANFGVGGDGRCLNNGCSLSYGFYKLGRCCRIGECRIYAGWGVHPVNFKNCKEYRKIN